MTLSPVSSEITVPSGAEEATPAWFTQVLRAAGALASTATVVAVEHSRVGNGLVCESIRFTLTYDGEAGEAPASVVCKFPSEVEAFRQVAAGELLYTRETTFYAELVAALDVRAPHCFHVARDEASGDFVLVLEDLGPAETGDQIAGCSLAQAEAVMDAAAGMHAPLWGHADLDSASWDVREPWTARIAETYPGLFAQYAELFGPRLGDDDLAIGRVFAPVIGKWFAHQPRPWTLTHGDFRLDNMLFEILGGAEPVGIVDWQTLLPAPGTADVAYFLGGCLPTDVRRDHERDLLRIYHDGLLARGVTGYPFERCWDDYRYNAFLGYFMATYAAMLVQRTERGDAMFALWLQRVSAQVQDLDALSLLPRP
ncbi:ecdysteroid 22-kinase family protein [Pseudonocardia sp. RS11V-5]|uniref:ecdysteroid 22-kinase family protein n=1 Tax=Pseudonocardia terrae TaxID=2905831 RepID=UPI001E4D98B7|nr:ecdysteroid 22-kinase family protein [Pseudonocardia terrae]MCE3552875.1 ecdysteroid 22-kinase family protein [Pseudonocardia terrae]